jgi:hypothetical protein
MKFFELSITVDEEDGAPVIFLSTYDTLDDVRHGVIVSPEQALIVAEELKRLAAELM